MTVQILNMFQNIFSEAFNILGRFFNAIPGMSALYIAFFFLFMAVKFFLIPFIGIQRNQVLRGGETKGYKNK